MNSIGTKIKEIRLKKGLSQEELAEKSQVSLRTIQRIENNENEPRGKTMQLICESLGANIEELLDYDKKEDSQFLMFFHLSVLCGIAIPTGNIILPLVLWLTKKDKIQGLQKMGARLLSFQIVWTCLYGGTSKHHSQSEICFLYHLTFWVHQLYRSSYSSYCKSKRQTNHLPQYYSYDSIKKAFQMGYI